MHICTLALICTTHSPGRTIPGSKKVFMAGQPPGLWICAISMAGDPCFTCGIAPDRHSKHARRNCLHPHRTEPEVVRLLCVDLKGLPERDEGIICVFWDLPSKPGGGAVQAERTGTPLPWEIQGGGGPGQLAPWVSPLPIPFLGDDVNSVSDVNPCRKTGGGCPFGYLTGGACH